MKWVYEEANVNDIPMHESRVCVRIRRNRQVSIPKLIIEQIEKFLPVSTNGRFYDFDIVLDVKAIRTNQNEWYRISPEGEAKRRVTP